MLNGCVCHLSDHAKRNTVFTKINGCVGVKEYCLCVTLGTMLNVYVGMKNTIYNYYVTLQIMLKGILSTLNGCVGVSEYSLCIYEHVTLGTMLKLMVVEQKWPDLYVVTI